MDNEPKKQISEEDLESKVVDTKHVIEVSNDGTKYTVKIETLSDGTERRIMETSLSPKELMKVLFD